MNNIFIVKVSNNSCWQKLVMPMQGFKKIIQLFIIFVFLNSYVSKAQDTVYFKNGKKEVLFVKSVDIKEIIASKSNDLKDELVFIPKKKVLKVAFANGEILNLDQMISNSIKLFHNNNIWFSVSELFFRRLNLTYERNLTYDGTLAIRVPLSVSLSDHKPTYNMEADPYLLDNHMYKFNGYGYAMNLGEHQLHTGRPISYLKFGNSVHLGLGLRIYIFRQAKTNLVFDMEYQYGFFSYKLNDYKVEVVYIPYHDYSYIRQPTKLNTGRMSAFFVSFGLRTNPIKSLSIAFTLGIGHRNYFNCPVYNPSYYSGGFTIGNAISFNPQVQVSYNFGKLPVRK